MRINTPKAVLFTTAAALIVVTATLAWYGTGPAGAAPAARNSARFSSLVFALALSLRARPDWSAGAMYAFTATHVVHYLAVIYLVTVAVHHRLQHPGVNDYLFVGFGILLLAAFAFTADRSGTWTSRGNAVAMSLIWLTFFGGAVLNSRFHWPSLIPGVVLVLAMGFYLRGLASGTNDPPPQGVKS